MAADANLRGKAKIEGAKKAASDLDKIADAQKKVTGQQKKAAEAAAKGAASTEDYSQSLSKMSPALGGYVEGLRGAFQIAGDLATRQISLIGIWNKGRAAITKNTKALKLLLAGGAVAVGIAAIAKSVSLMREEFAKAHAEIKRTQQALTEIKGGEANTRAAIESVADRRQLIKATTAAQSRSGLENFKGISRQFEQIDKSTLTDVVGGTLGLGLSREQIANTAILQQSGRFQIKPQATGGDTKRAALRAIEREKDFISKFRTRESRQGQGLGDKRAFRGLTERQDAAAKEAASGGSRHALNAVIGQRFPDLPQEDAERLAGLAQEQGNYQAFKARRAASKKIPGTETTVLRNAEPGFLPGTVSATRVSGSELANLEVLLRDLSKSNRELAESIKNQPARVEQHNGRYSSADGDTQTKRQTNGQSHNAEFE